MGNLTNTQKAKAQAYTAMWQQEWIRSKEKSDVLERVKNEGRKAILDMNAVKEQYLKTKDPSLLSEFNTAYGKVVAATTVLYTKETSADVAYLNSSLKKFTTEKLGIKESELGNFMRELALRIQNRTSIERLEEKTYIPNPEEDFAQMASQLSTPLPEVKIEEPAFEEPVKEEPKQEEEKPEPEPEPEPVKEEPKKITWQEQTNLPTVKGTMPAVIVEGALKLVKPENPKDKIPFKKSEDAVENAKRALDGAMAARSEFQSSRSQESRDAFYANMSHALLHYSRLAGRMDMSANFEFGKIQTRLMNDFGFSQNDLRRAATAIFGSERGVLRAWAPGEEDKLEDRALKIGAPDLQTTEIAEKAVEEPKTDEISTSMPKMEEFKVEEISTEDDIRVEIPEEPERQRISINLDLPKAPERGMEPAKPSITPNQINSMLRWKQEFANMSETTIMRDYLRLTSNFQSEAKSSSARDNAIGELFAMGNYFEKNDSANLAANIRKTIFENTSISESEIDVGMNALENNPTGIENELKDLKAREHDEQFKVPDKIKNFAHAKEMIDVNKKFFNNDYHLEKRNFLEFARAHYDALQKQAENPPLIDENNTQRALFDASVGMYPRLRAAYEKRGLREFILHPVDSWRERALVKNMKNTLVAGGMSEAAVESLYTEAKDAFDLSDLEYNQSLNGKTNPEESNDKLIDPREKAQVQNERARINPETDLSAALNQEMEKFQGIGKNAETKEFKQSEITEPQINVPRQ